MSKEILLPLSAAGGFALTAALFAFVYYRGLALLQFYQQEEYNTERFLVWLIQRRAFDKKATLIVLVAFIAWSVFAGGSVLVFRPAFYAILLVALAVGAWSSHRLRRYAKKPLVMTARANRIFYAYMILVAFYFAAALGHDANIYRDIPLLAATFLAFFQAPPLFVAAANFIMRPMEERINRRYIRQARDKLARLAPVVVGVTGSYGKTTTKHILAHVLSASAPTLATPASVNTELGITRVVREELKDHHKYFVVEMGAYGTGSIAALCHLVPPGLGIVTSVGLAHLERFKTIEKVFKAKFELVDDLKARGGKAIVNVSDIPEALLRNYLPAATNLVLCGAKGAPFPLEVALVSTAQEASGLRLKLAVNGKALDAVMPLYGEHNGKNAMLAVAAALELGLKPGVIAAALKTVPQIPHRLEVIRRAGGPTVIDDAYNSNPQGFASALDVLSKITGKKGRRILLTPGMVELGSAHDAEHRRLGAIAAKHADIALIVGPERMGAFIEAFNQAKSGKAELRTFAAQHEAEAWVRRNVAAADTVLFENNLPDLYEAVVEF